MTAFHLHKNKLNAVFLHFNLKFCGFFAKKRLINDGKCVFIFQGGSRTQGYYRLLERCKSVNDTAVGKQRKCVTANADSHTEHGGVQTQSKGAVILQRVRSDRKGGVKTQRLFLGCGQNAKAFYRQ